MNAGELGGWAGAMAGIIFGFAGGLAGTYFSIKRTNGPRERAFMIRAAVVCWCAILLFLGLLVALPNPYRWFMWIPYGILLPLGIRYVNRKQGSIRQEDARNQRPEGSQR